MKRVKKFFSAVILAILIFVTAACGGQGDLGSSDDQNDSDSSVDAYLTSLLEKDEFDDSITYDQLARYPDDYIGSPILLVGEIIQVIDGDNCTGYRFNINGDYSQTIYAETYPDYPIAPLLEGDYVTLSGIAAGEYTYEAVNGSIITVPAVLAVKMDITEIPLPQCPVCPITLKRDYGYASLNSTVVIDSFEISDAEIAYGGMLSITCQIVGTVTNDSFLNIKLNCYDSDGFLIDSAMIISSVKDGEPFRVSESAYIPMDTAEIRITAD